VRETFRGFTSFGVMISVNCTDAGMVLIILVNSETHVEINLDDDSASLGEDWVPTKEILGLDHRDLPLKSCIIIREIES
jgi:hypothetical protein